jgi:hypothetical protein
VCPQDPDIFMIEDKPDVEQQKLIDAYADKYFSTFKQRPLGLHYLDALGPVWLPLSEHWPGPT